MASRWSSFEIPQLGGLDESENPHSLLPSALQKAQNAWRLGGSVGTRPGTILDPDEVYVTPLAGPVMGMVDFRRNRDTDRTFVAVAPGAIHTTDGTTLTLGAQVDVTNTAQIPVCFAQHKNKLYGAGGDVAGGDTAWFWDPSAGTTAEVLPIEDIATNLLVPRYLHSWNNRLYAAGFSGTDPAGNPGIIRASALNDGNSWPTENTIGGNFSVGGFAADAEEYITGINSFSQADGRRWLLALTNRRIYPIEENASTSSLFRIAGEIPHGVVNHLAYVNLGVDAGDAIFMSESGIHSLRQSQQPNYGTNQFLSWPIRRTFESINWSSRDRIVGSYWRRHGIVVFAVPTGSSTQNDLILVLDLKGLGEGDLNAQSARWYKWVLAGSNHNVSCLAAGRDATNGRVQLYMGDYAGRVCAFSTAAYSDLGAGYTFDIETKSSHFNAPVRDKVFGDVYIDIGPGGNYSPQFHATFDFGHEPQETISLQMPAGGAEWDTAEWDADSWAEDMVTWRNKLYITGRGSIASFNVTHTGANEPVYIHGIFGEVAVSGEGTES